MKEKRVNTIMIVMSLLGGLVGFILGEMLLNAYRYTLPSTILMGLYFGILALCIGSMCLIAEIISPRLNGLGWKNNYLKTSFKFLIPCTLVLLFIFGTIFQYLYDINTNKFRKINDIVFAIDTSGSLKNTDPKNERFLAAVNLIDSMNNDNRFSIYKFDDNAEQVFPMSFVTSETKKEAASKLELFEKPNGNTNMRDVLEKSYEEIKSSEVNGRNAMVILLSDGGDNFDLSSKFDETIRPFKDKNIPIYTIGMSNGNNFSMLKQIAKESGGNYYNVTEVKDLKNIFNKIYKDSSQRLLVDKRNGIYESSSLYMVLRIAFITMLGALIAVSISLVFDNKNLLKRFLIGGVISGLIAGIIIEFGFLSSPWKGTSYRAFADIILALIFTLISVNVDVKDYSKKSYYTSGEKAVKIKNADTFNNNMFR